MAGSGDEGTTQNEQVLLQEETDPCRNVSSSLAVVLRIFSSPLVGCARELNARWAIGPALGTCPRRPGGKKLGCGVHSQLSHFDVPQGLVFSDDYLPPGGDPVNQFPWRKHRCPLQVVDV